MSPPWRDEVAIYLSPRKLALVRHTRGLWRREVASAEIALPAGGAGDLGPVLARLAEVLADPAWQGGTARAVVADRNLPDALGYLKRLQKIAVLRHPMLESHERRNDDPEHPLRIRLSAEWHP